MPAPRIETPTGTINGANKTFYVLTDYLPGSTRVFRNGLLLEPGLNDGWFELGPKKVQLKEAPRTGDVIQIYYLPIG